MSTFEYTLIDTQDDVVELGVVSVETQGTAGMRIEPLGFVNHAGISEE